jgi:RimJ/RimL family protein N-acetyltransferase
MSKRVFMHHIEQIKSYFAFDGLDLGDDGLFRPKPAEPSNDPPRLLVVKHAIGYTMWLKHDLPLALSAELQALPPKHAFHNHDAVVQLLAAYAPCESVWQGTSYTFPTTLTAADHPHVVQLNEGHRLLVEQYAPGMRVDEHAVFGIIADGRLVATCESSRENKLGGEAWVQTLPDYRGRGYARQTTAAWARHLQLQNKTPFYNHKRTNIASQALARSLGLLQFMAEVSYR